MLYQRQYSFRGAGNYGVLIWYIRGVMWCGCFRIFELVENFDSDLRNFVLPTFWP